MALSQYGTTGLIDQTNYSNLIVLRGPSELTPSEKFLPDPRLPIQGTQRSADYLGQNRIVIPRGRIVGPVAHNAGWLGEFPYMTMADGNNVKPMGFAPEDLFQQTPGREIRDANFMRAGYIELPYIQAVNDCCGPLLEGDYVSAYYGSRDSVTARAAEDIGKPVKWVERAINKFTTTAASGAVEVPYKETEGKPGQRPTAILAFKADGSLLSTPVTVAYKKAFVFEGYTYVGVWTGTYSAAVASVVYVSGQSPEHRAAQLIRLRQISAQQPARGWLQWVEDNYSDALYPPMVRDYPSTSVAGEVPVATAREGEYNLAHNNILPHKNIVITIKPALGTAAGAKIVNNMGEEKSITTDTVLGGFANSPFQNYTEGEYYRIDFLRGVLYISGSVTNADGTSLDAAKISVSYSYNTSYAYGLTSLVGQGVGQRNMTDGAYTGLPGTQTHLEQAARDRRFVPGGTFGAGGAFGAMRLTFG